MSKAVAPIIDLEFKALISRLTPEERAQLEWNLRKDGCRDPLVTWDGILLDGHNRLEICDAHRITYTTVDIKLSDRSAAMVWIIQNQFGRRNLTPYTRSTLALKLEPLIAGRAKSNQRERKGSQPGATLENSTKLSSVDTRAEVAKAANVSDNTLARVKKIEEKATPELKDQLHRGEVSINAAYTEVTTGKPHVSHNSGENEWYTPNEYIAAAHAVLDYIDLDPASSKAANQTVKAGKFYTVQDDGLSHVWAGKVWMNPPYASDLIRKFATKFAEHVISKDIKEGIVLVNNATETTWFRLLVDAAAAVVFPTGRVRFEGPDGAKGAPLQGQAVLYYGKKPSAFLKAFKVFGWGATL